MLGGTESMGITGFFRTIFGQSEEEKELRKRAEEEMNKRRRGTESIRNAQIQLQEVQERVHVRAEILKKNVEMAKLKGNENDDKQG